MRRNKTKIRARQKGGKPTAKSLRIFRRTSRVQSSESLFNTVYASKTMADTQTKTIYHGDPNNRNKVAPVDQLLDGYGPFEPPFDKVPAENKQGEENNKQTDFVLQIKDSLTKSTKKHRPQTHDEDILDSKGDDDDIILDPRFNVVQRQELIQRRQEKKMRKSTMPSGNKTLFQPAKIYPTIAANDRASTMRR